VERRPLSAVDPRENPAAEAAAAPQDMPAG